MDNCNHSNATNEKDWETYIDLQADINKGYDNQFINNPENEKNEIGLFNIKSAKVEEIQSLPDSVVSGLTKLSKYQQEYSEVQSYLVGIDYKVKNESKYYFNGVNYRLVVLVKENANWKIIEMSDAPIEILIPMGYGFNSNNEKKALNIVKERIKGNIINSEGKTINTNKANYRDIQLEKGVKPEDIGDEPMTLTVGTDDHVRPDYVRVYRANLFFVYII